MLLECPITAELFQKNGCDLNAYNNVRDILYNTDVFTNIVRSIVGKERKKKEESYLARVIYKLRLNSWNAKYSQNVTCVCKNILSVKHILLECPITTEVFQKKMDMF